MAAVPVPVPVPVPDESDYDAFLDTARGAMTECHAHEELSADEYVRFANDMAAYQSLGSPGQNNGTHAAPATSATPAGDMFSTLKSMLKGASLSFQQGKEIESASQKECKETCDRIHAQSEARRAFNQKALADSLLS